METDEIIKKLEQQTLDLKRNINDNLDMNKLRVPNPKFNYDGKEPSTITTKELIDYIIDRDRFGLIADDTKMVINAFTQISTQVNIFKERMNDAWRKNAEVIQILELELKTLSTTNEKYEKIETEMAGMIEDYKKVEQDKLLVATKLSNIKNINRMFNDEFAELLENVDVNDIDAFKKEVERLHKNLNRRLGMVNKITKVEAPAPTTQSPKPVKSNVTKP